MRVQEQLPVTPARALAPRYRVILHNDDANTMDHVVNTLRRVVPRLDDLSAQAIMYEAHRSGVALVIVCAFEPAEFYRNGLRSAGLGATIEQV
ncbi:MAG: ATP-dependent Clp protease adapter ClpS [Actinobacteria bacterium]|nr:ATP-dependent Clp protease adapter ClpS [Actinomycetota bacterium]MCG2807084.1 ATP-dependent Clp protease adapter ClpS [Coriobacteriia bacterium]